MTSSRNVPGKVRTNSFSRRDALRLAGGLSTAALIGSSASSTMARQEEDLPPIEFSDTGADLPAEETRFQWADLGGGARNPVMHDIAEAYHRAHPNITIEYDPMPREAVAQIISLGVQNGTAPDIFPFPESQLNVPVIQAVNQGWLAPLDELLPNFEQWKQAFPKGMLFPGVHIFDNKTYSFPISSGKQSGTLLFYNVPYMEQAGFSPQEAPLTWDDFRSAAKTITTQGNGDYYGLIIGGQSASQWSNAATNLAEMAGALGGEINWLTGEYNYTSDEFLAAIELLLSLKADGSVFPGSLSLNDEEARSMMPQGPAGMILQGTWVIAPWKQSNPDFKFDLASQPQLDPDTAMPLHVGPPGGAWWVYEGSANKTIAGDLLSYIGSEEGMTVLQARAGGVNPVPFPEANRAPSIDARWRKAAAMFENLVFRGPTPSVRNPDVAQVDLEMRPVTPNLGETVQGIYLGQLEDPRAAMQDLQDRSEAELERAIKAAKEKGAEVSRDDWVFPNWDPMKDYTEEDYAAL